MDNKPAKFQLGDLLPIGIMLTVLILAVSYGSQIMGEVKEDQCSYTWDDSMNKCVYCNSSHPYYNTSEYKCQNDTGLSKYNVSYTVYTDETMDATDDGSDAITNITDRLGTVAMIIVAVLIIYTLFMFMKM